MNESRPWLVIPGGAGFIGRIVTPFFIGRGWDVIVLTRRPEFVSAEARGMFWDGRTLGPWAGELDGAGAVLNLAGRSVNCRYTAANRRAIEWLIERPEISGPVNLAAPNPVTNARMMRIFRRLCHRPIGLPAARWMLEIGTFLMRTESELVIKSRRVVPGRLLAGGFEFRFPGMEEAVAELLQPPGDEIVHRRGAEDAEVPSRIG